MGEEKGIEGLIERFSDLPDARVEGRMITICWILLFWRCVP